MKQTLLLISALFLLSGCGSKTAKPVANDESFAPIDTVVSDVATDTPEPSSDEIVQNAIRNFLLGNTATRLFCNVLCPGIGWCTSHQPSCTSQCTPWRTGQ